MSQSKKVRKWKKVKYLNVRAENRFDRNHLV